MDSFQFLNGYQELQDPNSFNRDDRDRYRARNNFDTPEVKQLMTGPREWASLFDKIFYSFLEGYTDIDPETVNADLEVYETDWSKHHLEDLIKKSQRLAFYDADSAQAVNELNFHILTKEFMPLWRTAWSLWGGPFATQESPLEELETIQSGLASRAKKLMRMKNSAFKWQKIEDTPRGLVPAINGQLTELDAAIVMLEIQKEHPNLLLLPAGPQFESSRHLDRSVDFTITDRDTWQSRGIQVKTSIAGFEDVWERNKTGDSSKSVRNYDSNYVTLVDGMIDLGNFSMRHISGKGMVMKPNPGLISLNYLKDKNHPDILVAKNNIMGRILHDLEEN